jgi:hypothetical protein
MTLFLAKGLKDQIRGSEERHLAPRAFSSARPAFARRASAFAEASADRRSLGGGWSDGSCRSSLVHWRAEAEKTPLRFDPDVDRGGPTNSNIAPINDRHPGDSSARVAFDQTAAKSIAARPFS